MDKETLKKLLTKADNLEKGKEIALAKEFLSIDEKIDTVKESVANISEELKKKLEEELSYEVDEEKIAENVLSKVVIPEPIKGDKGDNYTLTDKDKKEIASSIKVPILEKIIEKTEVIRETPIVTNEIKEVAIYDTPDQVTDKVNLGTPLIKKERIEGLKDIEFNLKHNLYTGISETRALELISRNGGSGSVDPESKTITRNASGFITQIAGATKTYDFTRDADNFITSKTDGTFTWSYTRDASDFITSVAIS